MLHQVSGQFVDPDGSVLVGVSLRIAEGLDEEAAEDRTTFRLGPECDLARRAGHQDGEVGVQWPPGIVLPAQFLADQIGDSV